ncbi:Enoyl-CoA hydratase/carnithine racemase [Nocardioides scoriae]|uniref:Enoyl-CoA hydratase/carnithine racemase n=1 Tax=Nocardioides scoriae TaxID=642780 RepID=A0A1H1NAX6_9ACTN|nr:enoyl-CoA hydratase/isomerase family protein [Nocardioides scoriae]SDR96058.1 Enoyl-CoA hydratase/carnithine racemase [Nocardioides scoriae]
MTLPDTARLAAVGLRVTVEDDVLTVTLDKPERRNSQTPGLWRALAAVGEALPPQVRVVVVRGAGASFSAGLDTRLLTPDGIEGEESVRELMRGTDEDVLAAIDDYQRGFTWLADPAVVSVAAVQGHAIGAGFQLALACDLRVVADDARFCMKEPALGLVPDLTGTKSLVAVVGYSRALEICATARSVGAEEARQLGIATTVVPRDGLEAATDDLVQALRAHDPGAVRETKALLQSAAGLDLEAQRLAERRAQLRRFRAIVGGA